MDNKTCSNIFSDTQGKELNPQRIVLLIFLSLFPVVTIFGNILVVYTVIKLHKFQQKANVFVVSLALTDLAVAVFVMSFFILKQFGDMDWLTFRPVCWLSFSLDVMFTSTSILHLMCMTIDRYIAICLPFKYPYLMNVKSVTALLLLCWILPIIFSFGLIFNGVHVLGVEKRVHCKQCAVEVNIYYAVIGSLVTFYIPSVLMLVCNVKIFWKVRQQGRQLCELFQNLQQQQHHLLLKREIKVARTIAIMLSCFFLCWLPFFVLNIVDPIAGYITGSTAEIFVTWLGYVNSTINPYLYYFLNKPTKMKCCKFLGINCCHFCKMKTNIYDVSKSTPVQSGSNTYLDTMSQ